MTTNAPLPAAGLPAPVSPPHARLFPLLAR